MSQPAHTPADEMSPECFEAALEALDLPRWYRNPLVSQAIDKAWTDGARSPGEIAQAVLKSSLMIRRLVGAKQ